MSQPLILSLAPLALAAVMLPAWAEQTPQPLVKTERFDQDPGWEAINNRLLPKVLPTFTQDFGYSPTNFASSHPGEIGGRVCRAPVPGFYAIRIAPKTLNDKLSASGTLAITASSSGSGISFGWLNTQQAGASGRPLNSLGFNLDGEGAGCRLAVRLIGAQNKSCGTFITPFVPGKFRPTPLRKDGTRYAWTLDYDPQAAEGRGRFTFTFTSPAHRPGELETPAMPASHLAEARQRFPSTTTFSVDLPEGFKQEGATFDHFGLMNALKSGGTMSVYFGDLTLDGRALDLSRDPQWDQSANRGAFENPIPAGAHDFGYSPTRFAGGSPGEVGGVFWRGGRLAWYADRIGPLTADDRLEASGRVVMPVGGVDADMYFGWFNSACTNQPPTQTGQFLGIHVGGPTRVGHYFHPAFSTAAGNTARANAGPLLVPGKIYDWSLVYDPAAEDGRGAIRVTLGTESMTLPLKQGWKAAVRFDRFGLFNPVEGGQIVKIYLDDLKYSASRPDP